MSETNPLPRARLLPWHEGVVAQLRAAWRSQRFPHALLIAGADGLGKRERAAWLSCAVLGDRSGDSRNACGECASCKLTAAATQPDLLWVSPEEDKQQLSVDQIRATCER